MLYYIHSPAHNPLLVWFPNTHAGYDYNFMRFMARAMQGILA